MGYERLKQRLAAGEPFARGAHRALKVVGVGKTAQRPGLPFVVGHLNGAFVSLGVLGATQRVMLGVAGTAPASRSRR